MTRSDSPREDHRQAPADQDAAGPSVSQPPRRSWSQRFRSWALFCIYLLVLSEVGARAFWTLRYGISPLDTTQIWSRRFYPEVEKCGVLTTSVTAKDPYYDVLLLGGSVVAEAFGSIDKQLQRQLTELTGRKARVFNCANAALTTRDSFTKYRELKDKEFDLVVVYHGINDARLNNCPAQMFRADYTHSAWYYRIDALDRHPELPYFCLPYTLEHGFVSVTDSDSFRWYLPKHSPLEGWSDEGEQVKTVPSFRDNLSGIIRLAQQRNADVLLLGYAWYLPEDYTLEKFQNEQLDYTKHAMPVETIGTPRGVTAALREHNAVIHGLAGEYQNLVFVDQNELIPKAGRYFDDICHLSELGCRRFVHNLRQPLKEYLRQKSAGEDYAPSATGIIAQQESPTRR